MQKHYKKILVLVPVLFMFAGIASAQSLVPEPVQYLVAPEVPGPNQTVQIEAQGVGTFLGESTITWSNNGKVVLQGVGARDFSFTTGALGSQTLIHVSITSAAQGTLTHDFVFVPSLVNLVWEADTSVPPLYRGKALYSAGSNIKVVAFPTILKGGKQIPSSALSFQWSRGDEPAVGSSGLGQAAFTFAGDQLQNAETVSVDVYYSGSKVGSGSVTIPTSDPMLLLYDKDPLRGVLYDTSLPSAISLSSKEITVEAAPYYFSNQSLANGSLTYTWTLGGDEVTGPDSSKGILTLRQTGSGVGAAGLEVSVQNNDNDKLVQAAQAVLQIVFGSGGGTPSFGL